MFRFAFLEYPLLFASRARDTIHRNQARTVWPFALENLESGGYEGISGFGSDYRLYSLAGHRWSDGASVLEKGRKSFGLRVD